MTINRTQFKTVSAVHQLGVTCVLFICSHMTSCADGGLTSTAPTSVAQPAAPHSADDSKGAVISADETAPINFSCSCQELLDVNVRSPYTKVADAPARLQANCTYLRADESRDSYLSTVVYSGKSREAFDQAVARARKGYESVSDSKTETLGGGVLAAYFTGVGSKSRVLASVAFDPVKALMVEVREVRLSAIDFSLPPQVPASATTALGQAAWVCKKP